MPQFLCGEVCGMINFFSKDPVIMWQPVRCPVCNQPTGPSSRCFELEPGRSIPEYQKKLSSSEMILPLPIFSENCTFRQREVWEFNINYPLSIPLFEKIYNVEGAELVEVTGPYSGRLTVAKMFKSESIRREISSIFKTFIKSMQTLEEKLDTNKKIIGIKMPNGQELYINNNLNEEEVNAQVNYLKSVAENFEKSSLIELKPDDESV